MPRFDVGIWSSARRDNLMEVFEPAILERFVFKGFAARVGLVSAVQGTHRARG